MAAGSVLFQVSVLTASSISILVRYLKHLYAYCTLAIRLHIDKAPIFYPSLAKAYLSAQGLDSSVSQSQVHF